MGYQSILQYNTDVDGFDEAQLALRSGELEVICLIGELEVAQLLFKEVLTFRYSDEPYGEFCPEGAVDGVVVDDNSAWQRGLGKPGTWDFQRAQSSSHFITVISNCGVLEVIAKSVELVRTS